jgi:hypothetical protein
MGRMRGEMPIMKPKKGRKGERKDRMWRDEEGIQKHEGRKKRHTGRTGKPEGRKTRNTKEGGEERNAKEGRCGKERKKRKDRNANQ